MGNFISHYVDEKVKGILSSNDSVGIGIKDSVSQIINQFCVIRDNILTRHQVYTEFISGFLSVGSMPAPEYTDLGLSVQEFSDYQQTVSEDMYHLIKDSVNNAISWVKPYESLIEGITLTDAVGRVYNFVKRNEQIVVDGVTYYIDLATTSHTINSLQDAILYHTSNSYHVNYLIRDIINYDNNSEIPSPEGIETVSDALAWIAEYEHLQYNPNASIYDNLKDIMHQLGLYTGDDTIEMMVSRLCMQFYHQWTASSIFGSLMNLINYLSEDQPQQIGAFYLGDLLHDLSVSDTINDVLLKASDLIVEGKFSVDEFINNLGLTINDYCTEIKQIITGVSNAFSSGAIYGVISYICNIFSNVSKIAITDDGTRLTFTDNTSLVPMYFISGVVGAVIEQLSQVVSAIVSVFNEAIAVIIDIASTLFTWINKAFDYDYDNNTLSKVNESLTNNVLPYAPMALFQENIPSASFTNTDFVSSIMTLISQSGPVKFEIPGGLILCGYSKTDNTIQMEYHPAICDYSIGALGCDINWNYYKGSTQQQHAYRVGFMAYPGNSKTVKLNDVYNLWNSRFPLAVVNNAQYDVLSESSDSMVRAAILESLSISVLYMYFIEHPNTSITINNTDRILYGIINNRLTTPKSSKIPVRSDFYDQIECFDNFKTHLLIYFLSGAYVHQRYCNIMEDWSTSWLTLVQYFDNYDDNFTSFSFSAIGANYDPASLEFWSDYYFVAPSASTTSYSISSNPLKSVLNGQAYSNYPTVLPHSSGWLIKVPKYDRDSYLSQVIAFTVGIGLIVGATTIGILSVRQLIRQEQMRYDIQLKDAYDVAAKNPTDANIRAYNRLSFEANVFNFATNGTLYSRSSFWNRGNSNSKNTLGNYVSKVLTSLKAKKSTTTPISDTLDSEETEPTILRAIYTRITGNSY